MPLFKYRCRDCGEEFEELVSLANSNNVECPHCDSRHTEKLVSKFATIGSSSSGTSAGSCGSGRRGFT
ncbi:MAG: zinc ribbon domain-containing protein [Calditrichaeota bacterium]|nr:zinc ribbon domain-containing protein [Calditrichota bacterium]RQW03855.1 MAG: zinc ribbon domain-containing protein [Calditrichota bacterium]